MRDEKVKIIHSEKFSKFPGLIFGFSTIKGGISSPPFHMNLSLSVGDEKENVESNRKIFFNELDIDENNVSIMKQVHSSTVKYSDTPGFYPDCDAMFTDKLENFLCVGTADCIPVFLYEPVKKIVAVIHAGWRGTASEIVTNVILEMIRKFNSEPSQITAFIGPGISCENYEVSNEVAAKFPKETKIILNEKFHIDLKKANLLQLIKCGVRNENIEISRFCTFDKKELFHSHRREKGNTGRMMGVIGMKNHD